MNTGVDLLVVAPHPDDAELFCGGLLALAASRGQRAAILDLTAGELATRGSLDRRAAETQAARAALGLHGRENLGFPDGGIAPHDPQQVEHLAHALRRWRPTILVGPWRHDRHPDHEATHQLLRRAAFVAGLAKVMPSVSPHVPRALLWYPTRHLAEPSFVVDISAVVEQKRAAIACYASQVGEDAAAAPTLLASAGSLPALAARDAFYGAQIGAVAGEPYVGEQTLAIDDPVAHFGDHARGPAQLFPERR